MIRSPDRTSQSIPPVRWIPALISRRSLLPNIGIRGLHRYSVFAIAAATLFAASADWRRRRGWSGRTRRTGEACARERGLSLRLRPADAEARAYSVTDFTVGGGGLLSTVPSWSPRVTRSTSRRFTPLAFATTMA